MRAMGIFCRGGGKLGHPHSEMSAEDGAERAGRPKKKRTGEAKSLEVELDSGGVISQKNMMRSGIGIKKGAHLVVFGKFKQKEDVKMYIQLPDYGDSQCYDLGTGRPFKSCCS